MEKKALVGVYPLAGHFINGPSTLWKKMFQNLDQNISMSNSLTCKTAEVKVFMNLLPTVIAALLGNRKYKHVSKEIFNNLLKLFLLMTYTCYKGLFEALVQ